jgi:hypothetical protein
MLAAMGLLALAAALTGGSILPPLTALVGPTLVPLYLGIYHVLNADTIEEFEAGVDEITRALATGAVTFITAGVTKAGRVALGRIVGPRPEVPPGTVTRTPAGENGTGGWGGRLGPHLGLPEGEPGVFEPTGNGTIVSGKPIARFNGAIRINPPKTGAGSLAAGESAGTRTMTTGVRPRPAVQEALGGSKRATTSPVEAGSRKGGGLATVVKAAKQAKTSTQEQPRPGAMGGAQPEPTVNRRGGSNWFRKSALDWLREAFRRNSSDGRRLGWAPFNKPPGDRATQGYLRDRDNREDR